MNSYGTGRRAFITVLIVVVIASFSCTTRVVYETDIIPPAVGAVNINSATVAELEVLPGVGQKTAEAIVEHRTRNGEFRRVEHIMLVRGMSEKRFLEMRYQITN